MLMDILSDDDYIEIQKLEFYNDVTIIFLVLILLFFSN